MRERGFTLLELIVVMAVMMVLMAALLPAFQSTLRRTKLQGAAQEAAILMRKARFEAVKRNRGVAVTVNRIVDRQVTVFVDQNSNGVFNPPQDMVLTQFDLPSGINATAERFHGDNAAVYLSNGSVVKIGSMEFTDRNGNRLRVYVEPEATARVEMRKWEDGDFYAADEKVWKF